MNNQAITYSQSASKQKKNRVLSDFLTGAGLGLEIVKIERNDSFNASNGAWIVYYN
jgi:hypothetical protein